MKKNPVQKILPVHQTNTYLSMVWMLLQTGLLLGGASVCMGRLQEIDFIQFVPYLVIGTISMGCLLLAEWLQNRQHRVLAVIVHLFPFGYVLLQSGFQSLWRGACGFTNLVITGFNQIHEKEIALFTINAGEEDIRFFSLFLIVVCCEIIWRGVWKKRPYLCVGFCVFWLAISLLSDAFSPGACTHLFIGLLCVEQTENETMITRRSLVWVVAATVVFMILANVVPTQKMTSMAELREQIRQEIYTLRYGKDTLPEGDIRQAAILQESDEIMLSVTTQQKKELYFRGYVGACYESGRWIPLKDSAYTGEYAGMLNWLSMKGFDPFLQKAQYYDLSTGADLPVSNEVSVSVKNASRYYLYTPISLVEQPDIIGGVPKKDMTLKSRGLFGRSNYRFSEMSGQRPGELTVAEGWVSEPDSVQQQQYLTAEAVYREFVYDNYTKVDAGLAALIDDLFWQDYESDSDGVYSAISHIRKVLEQRVSYIQTPLTAPEDVDPVIYFLTDSRQGNAVQYASVAVEALRAHGIPARYVEGYYLSANEAATFQDAKIRLTGQNAHAWVEAYLDGVGWIPLDVTPGYYYDVKTLRTMVSLPDTVRKTAAFENDGPGADKVTDMENDGANKGFGEKAGAAVKDLLLTGLGVLAVLIVLFSISFVVLETGRGIRTWKLWKRYENSEDTRQIFLLEKLVFHVLSLLEIEGVLGYETEVIDAKLVGLYSAIQSGEYTRVCALLEQTIYGDILPKPYEKRTIEIFLKKLVEGDQTMDLFTKWKLRYACLTLNWRK